METTRRSVKPPDLALRENCARGEGMMKGLYVVVIEMSSDFNEYIASKEALKDHLDTLVTNAVKRWGELRGSEIVQEGMSCPVPPR